MFPLESTHCIASAGRKLSTEDLGDSDILGYSRRWSGHEIIFWCLQTGNRLFSVAVPTDDNDCTISTMTAPYKVCRNELDESADQARMYITAGTSDGRILLSEVTGLFHLSSSAEPDLVALVPDPDTRQEPVVSLSCQFSPRPAIRCDDVFASLSGNFTLYIWSAQGLPRTQLLEYPWPLKDVSVNHGCFYLIWSSSSSDVPRSSTVFL